MKTIRLETVFRSFRKYGCLCGFHRFLCLIQPDIYVVFVNFCLLFYCSQSICENVISLVISVFFGNFAKVYLVFAGCFPSSVKF